MGSKRARGRLTYGWLADCYCLLAMTPEADVQTEQLEEGLQLAAQGSGDLLERDYWGAIANCRLPPRALMADLLSRFCEFPPEDLVSFTRVGDGSAPLQEGDELDIVIRMAGKCRARVTCCEQASLTLATLSGHPEAGRITFGSYRHETGAVIFHIRSRSRSGDFKYSAGFLAFGEAMQTNTWTDFVRTVANTYGDGIDREVHAETTHVEPIADDAQACRPTFRARSDD